MLVHVPGPDPPDPNRLEHRAHATDQERREGDPGQVARGLAGRAADDDGAEHHRRQDDHRGLEAHPGRYGVGRAVLRLEADRFILPWCFQRPSLPI